jgi:diguanylate cyclase (GGDEF)-like protein
MAPDAARSDRPAALTAAAQVAGPEADVVLTALRALLRIETRADAATALQVAVRRLGGEIVPARGADTSDLPVDVSLGIGEPLVVRVPRDASARQFLVAHISSLVEDAVWAASRSDRNQRDVARATIDALTKVGSRAEVGARLGRSTRGDVVCVLDLDHLKVVNDTRGHQAGDTILKRFGTLLLGSIRDDDFAGRSGGDEFVTVLSGIPIEVASERMRFLVRKWRVSGHHSNTVSVGVAMVDDRGGAAAAVAADRAMYRAKRSGRGAVEVAAPDDYPEGPS